MLSGSSGARPRTFDVFRQLAVNVLGRSRACIPSRSTFMDGPVLGTTAARNTLSQPSIQLMSGLQHFRAPFSSHFVLKIAVRRYTMYPLDDGRTFDRRVTWLAFLRRLTPGSVLVMILEWHRGTMVIRT